MIPPATNTLIQSLNNQELWGRCKSAVANEREATLEVLDLLREIDHRLLYSEHGFSSLHRYCVEVLGYSEAAAQRRIQVMRLIQALPEIREKFQSGVLTLSNAAMVQQFFTREKVKMKRYYPVEEQQEIIDEVSGKSRLDCERILLKRSPQGLCVESIRAVGDGEHLELSVLIDRDLDDKHQRLKNLLSHRLGPASGTLDLMRMMADDLLKKLDPSLKKTKRAAARPAVEGSDSKMSAHSAAKCDSDANATKKTYKMMPATSKPRIYIRGDIRQQVWLRDNGCCTWVDPVSGRRCQSEKYLHIDHIVPRYHGGTNEVDNLRVLCGNHNQLAAVQTLGPEQMALYLRSLRSEPGVEQ